MSRKWYGSLQNRLEEGRQFVQEIKVGTGMTEYHYSDRSAYEVVAVQDQKHVSVRKYDHVHAGDGCMGNNWTLVSNPENPVLDLVKRGDTWYWTSTITAEELKAIEADDMRILRLAVAGWDLDKIRTAGKQTRRQKANVSFGKADYYYNYEF